ncbi:MAG: MerR family transcriptional regulator [Chloroflexi bacterium]|nr:MerR family transcriptional regulator [Chloroflexota bacterium]
MTTRRDEPLYVISIAARMLGVHAQTLRYYERAGLIAPSRSQGNRRYYSELDLERVRRIKTLMDDMGMNLAGAEVTLRLMERIGRMETEIQELRDEMRRIRMSSEPPALREAKEGEEGREVTDRGS